MGTKIVLDKITNVKDLRLALSSLPGDAKLYPFGSADTKLVYDGKNKTAYIDENFDFLDDLKDNK